MIVYLLGCVTCRVVDVQSHVVLCDKLTSTFKLNRLKLGLNLKLKRRSRPMFDPKGRGNFSISRSFPLSLGGDLKR